jgi:hypothetical protein
MVEEIEWHQAKLKQSLDELAVLEANIGQAGPNAMIDGLKRKIALLENLITAHRKQNAPRP